MESAFSFSRCPMLQTARLALLPFVSIVLGCSLLPVTARAQDPPNIIFILADDLSWGDLGCYGQTKIQTPNIDRLAAEGIRFTNAYAGNAVCAPSRSCLMQGLHPGHARVRGNSYKSYREGLKHEDLTIAEVLQDAGYTTGLFGKWGLGLVSQPEALPNRQGFDVFFGYLNQRHAHSYYPPYLYDQTQRVEFPAHAGHQHGRQSTYDAQGRVTPSGIADPARAQYSYDVIHERSLDFIRAHQDQPFFLYLAHTLPHGPLIVPELGAYRGTDWALGHKEWAAMVSRLDRGVGDVLSLLEELDLDENTLIFFASDNGHSTHGYERDESVTPIGEHFKNSGPTRGQKGGSYDGSFRVPAIARWSGKIAPGQVSDQVWAFWDFFPTAAEVAGVPTSSLPEIDGISILPTLLGKHGEQKQHDYLYWEYNQNQAIRTGPWFAHRRSGSEHIELYNLESDPEQQQDVSQKHPELVSQIGDWMNVAHSPSDVWPSPGESQAEFQQRLKHVGVPPRPANIDD